MSDEDDDSPSPLRLFIIGLRLLFDALMLVVVLGLIGFIVFVTGLERGETRQYEVELDGEIVERERQVIAQRMTESLRVSAQLTTVQEVDVTRIARLRARAKAEFERRMAGDPCASPARAGPSPRRTSAPVWSSSAPLDFHSGQSFSVT